VANGAGSFGGWPCVTCAGKLAASTKLDAKQKMILRFVNFVLSP